MVVSVPESLHKAMVGYATVKAAAKINIDLWFLPPKRNHASTLNSLDLK